jgi:hypothetical protein
LPESSRGANYQDAFTLQCRHSLIIAVINSTNS